MELKEFKKNDIIIGLYNGTDDNFKGAVIGPLEFITLTKNTGVLVAAILSDNKEIPCLQNVNSCEINGKKIVLFLPSALIVWDKLNKTDLFQESKNPTKLAIPADIRKKLPPGMNPEDILETPEEEEKNTQPEEIKNIKRVPLPKRNPELPTPPVDNNNFGQGSGRPAGWA